MPENYPYAYQYYPTNGYYCPNCGAFHTQYPTYGCPYCGYNGEFLAGVGLLLLALLLL